jgi:DNA-binding MarR family transcriptional regulator
MKAMTDSRSREPPRLPPLRQEHAGQAVAGAGLLFLREEEIRLAQDLLFLAYRDLTRTAEPLLAERGLGRAHHRALHFIGRNPGIAVGALAKLLGITKQSLGRVITELSAQGLVEQIQSQSDRRQHLLHLTQAGIAFEQALFERQRERLVAAYREAGATAVEGFRRVLRALVEQPKPPPRAHSAPSAPTTKQPG